MSKAHPKQHIVLTFNGGGVMGQNSAQIYKTLERLVLDKATTQNIPLTKLSDVWTSFGGTSIGAFNAAKVLTGATGEELLSIYNDHGQIFGAHKRTFGGVFSPKYDRTGLDKALTKYLGDTPEIRAIDKLIVIPSFSLTRGEPTIWTNYDQDNTYYQYLHTTSQGTLASAVAASTAAPIFLGAAKVQYNNQEHFEIDGGIFANNPTLLTLEMLEARNIDNDLNSVVVINIGTGSLDLHLTDSALTGMAKGGINNYLQNKYIFGAVSGAHDQYTSYLANRKIEKYGGQYFKFTPSLTYELFGLDNDQKAHLDKLAQHTDTYLQEPAIQEELNLAADAIIEAYLNNTSV